MKKTLATIFSTLFVLFSLAGCGANNPANSESYEGHPRIVTLQIVGFNDFHGNTLDSETGLGISKTASVVNEVTNNKLNTIILSQGDMWQGSAEAGLTFGSVVNDWMNDLNFVSMTVGNHEFDWNTSHVKANAEAAKFPYLGINVYSRETYERVDYLDPSVIVNKNGAKIGIIGAIGDCYSSISSSMVEDIYFVVGSELTTLVINEALRLRNEEHCNFIIYSVHDGRDSSGYNPYSLNISSYVDLVLEGHTHIDYRYLDSKGVYHIQGGGYNETINYINVDVNLNGRNHKINKVESITTNDYFSLAKDTDSEAIFAKYDSVIGHVHDVIGYNRTRKNSTYLQKTVATLYLNHGLEKWGSQYDIVLGGGYIKTRSPYNLDAGDVTYADLYYLFPFNNDLVLCSIKGTYLSSQFISEPQNYSISYSTYGDSVKYDVDPNATYYIVTDTYSSDYSPNHATVIDTFSTSGYYARDMLKDYIAEGRFA